MNSVEYHKQHYQQNKSVYVQRNRTYKLIFESVVDKIKSRPCFDCGNTFPPCAMDFDHVRGRKTANISLLRSHCSPAWLLSEIQKCEIVCANCHRVRTSVRSDRRPRLSMTEILDILSKRKKYYDRTAWESLLRFVGEELPPLPEKPVRQSRCVRKIGPDGLAWCRTHKDFVPEERFERNSSRWNGLQGQCADCRKKMPSRRPKVSRELTNW